MSIILIRLSFYFLASLLYKNLLFQLHDHALWNLHFGQMLCGSLTFVRNIDSKKHNHTTEINDFVLGGYTQQLLLVSLTG